jgi:hypothetical protein
MLMVPMVLTLAAEVASPRGKRNPGRAARPVQGAKRAKTWRER